jgi:hypothetical protein
MAHLLAGDFRPKPLAIIHALGRVCPRQPLEGRAKVGWALLNIPPGWLLSQLCGENNQHCIADAVSLRPNLLQCDFDGALQKGATMYFLM